MGVGGDLTVDKLKGMVDNMMGKVLLKIIRNKKKEIDENTSEPSLFGEVIGLTELLAKDLYMMGRKMKLLDFWKEELTKFENMKENNEVVSDAAAVDFICGIVEKYSV